jgi:hypothetical protein
MSYGMGAALQAAVYAALQGDAALAALAGGRIYDAAPAGAIEGLHVTLGPEEVRDRSDGSGAGALHEFTVSVVSDAPGFAGAKAAAAAVSDVLSGQAALPLARGRLVWLHFLRARARLTDRGARRRIDLRFRARVEDD